MTPPIHDEECQPPFCLAAGQGLLNLAELPNVLPYTKTDSAWAHHAWGQLLLFQMQGLQGVYMSQVSPVVHVRMSPKI